MNSFNWKTASKSLTDLPIQYYAYLKQSNPKFFPGNYFTIPETIHKGLEFIEDIWSSTNITNNDKTTIEIETTTDGDELNNNKNVKFITDTISQQELYSSVLCLELLSDLENISKNLLRYLKKLIRYILKIAPFSFIGIQDILEHDVSSAALVTWILMKEEILTKHGAKYLARLIISKIHSDNGYKLLDPMTSVNVMRLLYQVGLYSELIENYLYDVLESKSYLKNENHYCSPDAFLYFLSTMISNCPSTKNKFEDLLIKRLEERINEPTEHLLDSSMKILSFEAVGLLQSAKIRNHLCEEFTKLKNLQTSDGSWACSRSNNSLLWGKGIGIGVNLLSHEVKVITSAFALKAVHVFYERRIKSLVGNNHSSLHNIS